MSCHGHLQEAFAQKLDKTRNDIKIRVLTKRLYDAKDKLDEVFAEIDAVNKEIRILNQTRRKEKP